MSRSRSRKGFSWSTVAEDSAECAKFAEVRHALALQTFSLGGEVSPCVQVRFQRVTFAEVAPESFLSIYVDAFEGEWRDRLLRTGLAPELEPLTFGLHMANVDCMSPRPWVPFSPSDEDVAAVREWLDRAFEYAKRLPSSMDSLVAAIRAGRIADHSVEAYLGHPVKVRGFVEWLRRTQGVDLGDRLLPLLSDRTDPYDVRVMLGTV